MWTWKTTRRGAAVTRVARNGALALAAAATAGLLSACSLLEGEVTRLPYDDDFSRACDWVTKDDDLYSLSCTNGTYRVLLKRSGPVWSERVIAPEASAVELKADAVLWTGPPEIGFGLACHRSDTDGYSVVVSPSGGYSIFRAREGRMSVVADGAVDPVPGISFRVRVECVGDGDGPTTIILAVDGVEVASARDRDGVGPFSAVGFYVQSDGGRADVRFDNFSASVPRRGAA